MTGFDWLVMSGTILFIVGYGLWKSRGNTDIKGYLLADNSLKWWTIGLSIMATQASAITFLSTPGQAFDDGMRFVQFYFGVPIAMVLISIVAIPIYRRLNVFTAYEYLEGRFDLKTRSLTATLFLISRGLAAGMTIYAPAIILSALLGWDIDLTCVGIGIVVMIYTVSGGTKAVSQTQKQQMAVILVGMILAGILMVLKLPPDVSFGDAINIAGKMGKLNTITMPKDFSDFFHDKYNLLSGLVAGTFLMLSYFGTDQSQVQRYLGGKSVTESRLGLMFNGIFKVPMQFLILFIGVMMFVFYQFTAPPLFFNSTEEAQIAQSEQADAYDALNSRFLSLHEEKAAKLREMIQTDQALQLATLQTEVQQMESQARDMRTEAKELIKTHNPNADLNDLDQVFLTFILDHLPIGLVGLLMAVILSAAMSSTSAELNALATTSIVDIYKRSMMDTGSPTHYLRASKVSTMLWGILAIGFALIADSFGNLIQAVNLLGSLFYGTILGIFVIAFFFKWIKGTATFWAAVAGEIAVVAVWLLPQYTETFSWLNVGFLWYNLIGCAIVVGMGMLIQSFGSE
ncbi:MAG: sodium:solute symporter [Bacteroidota bacterium]